MNTAESPIVAFDIVEHLFDFLFIAKLNEDIHAAVADGVEQGDDFVRLDVDDLDGFAGVEDALIHLVPAFVPAGLNAAWGVHSMASSGSISSKASRCWMAWVPSEVGAADDVFALRLLHADANRQH